jgi:Tol biopolymer transport system component
LALTPGTRLGVYEVTAAIGEGGMGQVFRARDTRLHRDVALKVLPDSFAADRDRVARFTAEAKTLASLNHPHIAAIYGLEERGATRALVMEHVPGEDLSTLIARGPLTVGEAVAIARQIADALDAAHEQGIIHRDLKPGNIKIRDDGTVKVLDFGLAKAMATGGSATNLTAATVTSPATESGVVLGTAAYMSPEQARGKPLDKRTDIWAFGVIVFEMLTGGPLFAGDTVTDTLAAVLTREIEWHRLPPATPPTLRRVLTRTLERDPRSRLRDIGDVKADLDPARAADPGQPGPRGGWNGRWRLFPWAVTAGALSIAGWMAWGRPPAATATGVTYASVSFPRDVEPVLTLASGFGVSPDGRRVFMIGVKNGRRQLLLRSLDSLDVTEIQDAAGVNGAAFSPDGNSLALLVGGGVVAKLSLADRQRTQVTNAADISGGLSWSEAGILYSRNGAVWIAPADGGAPRALTTIDPARREVLHDRPATLPGGRAALFASLTSEPGTDRIESVTFATGARAVVVDRATTPVLTRSGHLLFARDGTIFAVRIDPETAAVEGAAVPVIANGEVEIGATGSLAIRLSASGTLVTVPAGHVTKTVWSVGRDGAALAYDLPKGRYSNPRVSPDGRRVLLERDGTEMTILDLARNTLERLGAVAYGTNFGTWTSGSDRVVFRLFNTPVWMSSDGSGAAVPVPGAYVNNYPTAPGPDPDSVFMVRIVEGGSGDISLVSTSGAFPPKSIVATPGYDGGPTLSPDGRWLLFMSTMSGQAEAYVKRYPALDRQWQVSAGGATQVRWSADGREIYYRAPQPQHFMSVGFDGKNTEPEIGKPAPLFADVYDFGSGISIPNYDVMRGGRFILIRRDVGDTGLQIAVNWISELERIIAAGGLQ